MKSRKAWRKLSPAQRLWWAVFRDPNPPRLDERRVWALVQDRLDGQERRALELRFGLKGGRPRSLPEVGRQLPRADGTGVGMSGEGARQKIERALRKLRLASCRAIWRAAVQQ